jgi:hypothetical protein
MELALGSPEQAGEIKIGCPAWKMMIMCVEITGGGIDNFQSSNRAYTNPWQTPLRRLDCTSFAPHRYKHLTIRVNHFLHRIDLNLPASCLIQPKHPRSWKKPRPS